jgi:transcriptional regulator with XRE-family HTH domain
MINIDTILREKGLNKTELTKRMGFKQRLSLYNILHGNPMLENIEKLAEALDVPVSRLFPSEVNGYLEIRGTIYKISSKKDIENALAALD